MLLIGMLSTQVLVAKMEDIVMFIQNRNKFDRKDLYENRR
jgi:hypothetical protein